MIFYVLILACGVTFCVTRIITHSRLVDTPRTWVINHSPEIIGYFVRCTWCVSVWVSVGVVLVLDRYATVPLPWAVALTASAVTGVVESHIPEE